MGRGRARAEQSVKQFEIRWVDLPEPAGRRPVLLLSRNDAYGYLSKFISVEITQGPRNLESLPQPAGMFPDGAFRQESLTCGSARQKPGDGRMRSERCSTCRSCKPSKAQARCASATPKRRPAQPDHVWTVVSGPSRRLIFLLTRNANPKSPPAPSQAAPLPTPPAPAAPRTITTTPESRGLQSHESATCRSPA